MQMNPYEPLPQVLQTDENCETKQGIIVAAIGSMVVTTLSVPVCAWYAIKRMASLVVSDHGMWQTGFLMYSIISAVPIALVSLYLAKLIYKHNFWLVNGGYIV
jgi:uncharacterized protein YybS (DUF2232 family)